MGAAVYGCKILPGWGRGVFDLLKCTGVPWVVECSGPRCVYCIIHTHFGEAVD